MQHVVAGFINIVEKEEEDGEGEGEEGGLVFTKEGVSHVRERERVRGRRESTQGAGSVVE